MPSSEKGRIIKVSSLTDLHAAVYLCRSFAKVIFSELLYFFAPKISIKGVSVTTEKKGVKETLDLLSAIESLVVALDVANDDGKISITDLPKFMPVVAALYEAAKGISSIPEELKDLDAEEVQQIAQKATDIAITGIRLLLGEKAA